ncbi:hypothetical protein GX50_06584 [[Emmonsia] crescens]|uniref:Mitochondrial carrier protein n=1 Tax=[Emmonsia] crescens TaxID=73230 RepID=A0A2B7ZCA4_9EURO|nr:hypothetical protein GX50_06584 [Emmonsia crescens]
MPNDRDMLYEASIESFELYHIYHDPRSHATGDTYRPGSEDWKVAVLKGPALPALGQAAAGAAGAAVSTISTYPLSLIVTRLQLQRQLRGERERERERERQKEKGRQKGKGGTDADASVDVDIDDEEEYQGIIDGAKKIYKNEGGLRGLYTGLTQATGKAVVDSFAFFLVYSFLRQRRLRARGLKMHGSFLPVLDELAVGYLAESFTKLLTTPISTVLTRKQVEGLSSSSSSSSSSTGARKQKAPGHISSTRDILSAIIAEKGLRGLWSGYSASLILSLNPSLTFLLTEFFKFSLLPREKRRHPPASATFLFAAVSKVIASSLTYPFSMAKTRAQATSTSTSTAPPPTILHAIHSIARTEGPAALYAGLSGDVLRGFFSHGIAMLAKDTVYTLVVRAYYLLLVMARQYPSPEELLAKAKARAEEFAEGVREGAGEFAERAGEKVGDMRGVVVKGIMGSGSGSGSGSEKGVIGRVADGVADVKRRVVEDVYEDSNATAEMVGDYVEDEAEEWRSLYRWFWEKGKS